MDPDGKTVETLWDIVSVASEVKNLVRNIKDHNAKGAVDDVAGIAIAGKSYRAEQQVRKWNKEEKPGKYICTRQNFEI